jgi:hypothetical protein
VSPSLHLDLLDAFASRANGHDRIAIKKKRGKFMRVALEKSYRYRE